MHKAHPPPPGYSSVACNAPLYNKRRRSRGGLGGTPSNVWGKMGGDLTIDHKLLVMPLERMVFCSLPVVSIVLKNTSYHSLPLRGKDNQV